MNNRNCIDHLLSHWLLAAALILVVAVLTIPQIDRLAMTFDERRQYIQSFGIMEAVYTASDALAAIRHQSPSQVPLGHLLLYFWGHVAGHSLAVARLPAVFAGLMSLAMVYRLSRDFISPVGGAFAVFILSSHAMYAFYFAHVRYYTLLVLLAAVILWLYLRIARCGNPPPVRLYLSLAIASAALVCTHVFGFVLYVAVSLYHLIAVRKDWRWLKVVAAALVGLALATPLVLPTLTENTAFVIGTHGPRADALDAILAQWLMVNSNGSRRLFAVVAVAAIATLLRARGGSPFLLLLPLLLAGIAIASAVTGVVSTGQMRYFLVGTPIVAGFIATGVFALYRLRRWLGLLALMIWLAAGLHFNSTFDWHFVIQGRTQSFTNPPWHLVSRWLQRSGEKLPVVVIEGLRYDHVLDKDPRVPVNLKEYYFGQHGIHIYRLPTYDIADFVASDALLPSYWAVYQTTRIEPAAIAAIDAAMQENDLIPCDTTHFPNATVLVTYRRAFLQCETQPNSSFATAAGAIQHYGAVQEDAKLLFAGLWQPASDAPSDALNVSFQLLDGDWHNHAQIDLPVSSLFEMRQFHFNLSELPAGDYRLMVVVYDAQTGEKQTWRGNEGWIPEMQLLAELEITD